MGSWTSGRGRNAWRENQFWRLDLARLKAIDCLKPGQFSISWSSRGDQKASIQISIDADMDRMILDYKSRTSGGDWETIYEAIPLDQTHPKFGGVRYWFMCLGCGNRRRVLYGRGRYRCRTCWRMTYSSQHDTFPQNPWERCHRTRERLGGERGYSNLFPRKPKGMHWRTYYRLRDADQQAEELMCQVMNERLLGIRRRLRR